MSLFLHRLRFGLAACLLLLLPCHGYSKQPQIVITGDLRGEIEPCGCSEEGDMGGLLRRATYLTKQEVPSNNVLYVDLGNNFPNVSGQGDLKIELIQSVFELFPPDAILIGPNELAYGKQRLNSKLPYFFSNQQGDWSFPKYLKKSIQGKKIQIWGYLSPTQIYQNPREAEQVLPVSEELLVQWKKQIQSAPDSFHLLLFRGNSTELQRFNKSGLFDAVVAGSSNDDELNQILTMPIDSKQSIPMIPTKGQGIYQGPLEKNLSKLQTIWLRTDVADSPKVKPIFDKYNDEVKALFFKQLDLRDQQEKESKYAGAATCQGCHTKAHEVWRTSKHASAFQTLEKEKKQFDPECVQCHVVGFQDSGFLSSELTPHLKNVQCENCHGAAKQHLQDPKKYKPHVSDPKQSCTGCHQGSHSPSFRYEGYWPHIQH